MFKNFSLLRPIVLILIIFIPLYPKFPLFNVQSTYVAIRLDDIVVTSAVLIWFLYQIKNKFPIFSEKITWLFIAYYLSIIASFINALLIHQTEPVETLILHLLRRFEYTSLFFVTISALHSKLKFSLIYLFISLANIGVILYGYGQKYWQFPVVSTMNSEFSKGQLLQMNVWTRISSTFAGHYDLAAYLSILLVIIGGVVVTTKNIFNRIANIIFWLFSYHILTLTASRVSIFAFFSGSILLFILLKKYLWIIPLSFFFIIGITNSKDLNQRLIATIPALKKQFLPVTKPTDIITPTISLVPTTPVIAQQTTPIPSTKPIPTVVRHGPTEEYIPIDTDVGVARSGEIRFNAEWPRAINALHKNILLGTGLGSITLATDNDYLRSLGESGIIGFIAFIAIFFYFCYLTYLNPQPINLIFFSATLTFLANATLIDVFEASKTAYLFWIMMAVYYSQLHVKSK